MGYMGFGMRKENYSRKPKKAFEKIKQVYGENVCLPEVDVQAKTSKLAIAPIKRFKHFYQTKAFKIIRVGTLLLGCFLLVWEFYLKHLCKIYAG